MYFPSSTSCAKEGIGVKADKSAVNFVKFGAGLGFFWQNGLPFLRRTLQTCQKYVS